MWYHNNITWLRWSCINTHERTKGRRRCVMVTVYCTNTQSFHNYIRCGWAFFVPSTGSGQRSGRSRHRRVPCRRHRSLSFDANALSSYAVQRHPLYDSHYSRHQSPRGRWRTARTNRWQLVPRRRGMTRPCLSLKKEKIIRTNEWPIVRGDVATDVNPDGGHDNPATSSERVPCC